MNSQLDLFSEQKEEKEPEPKPEPEKEIPAPKEKKPKPKKDNIAVDTETDDEHPDVIEFREHCRRRQVNWFLVFIGYTSKRSKSGEFVEGVSYNTENIREFGEGDGHGTCYGSGEGIYRGRYIKDNKLEENELLKEEVEKFVEAILYQKQSECATPYCKGKDDWILSDVHWNDMHLIIGDRAEQFLAEYVDIEDIFNRWDKITGREATAQEIQDSKTIITLNAEIEKLGKDIYEMEKIIQERCHIKTGFSREKVKQTLDNQKWFTMNIDELVKELEYARHYLEIKEQKVNEVRNGRGYIDFKKIWG